MMCPDCTRVMASNTWKAVVQVRQKVEHKKTFLFLEQLILKQSAHRDCINIKDSKDGLDFYFATRPKAIKFVDFMQGIAPIRYKASEQIQSSDMQNATASFRFTYSVELVPVCKDDLLCLPLKIARSLSNVGQFVLCTRIGSTIQFLETHTLKIVELSPTVYWRTPFPVLMSAKTLSEFFVLDVELLGQTRGRYALCDLTVARSADFGKNDQTYLIRSHLGNILKPGDTCLGYDLQSSNLNNSVMDLVKNHEIPEIVCQNRCRTLQVELSQLLKFLPLFAGYRQEIVRGEAEGKQKAPLEITTYGRRRGR